MSRAPLALAIETPIWSGSPHGVLCFPSPTKSLDRKSSKRWSLYNRKRKEKNNQTASQSPIPQQLTSEPDDITDRLCVRRKWTSSDNFRAVNIFEDEASPTQIWRQETPTDTSFSMFSWRGVECPDVPDSRLVNDPSPSLNSSGYETPIHCSNPALHSRANSMNSFPTDDFGGMALASTATSFQTLKRQTSLRKVEVPKPSGDVPSLKEVKALLKEEAKNLPAPLKLIPILPSNHDSKSAGFAKFLLRFSSRRSPEQQKTISAPIVESIRAPIRRNLSLGSVDRRIKPPIPPKPQFQRNSLSSSSGDSQSTTSSIASDQTLTDEDRSVDIRCDLDDVLIMDLLKTLDIDEEEKVKLARKESPNRAKDDALSELDAAMEKDQEILGQWLRSIHFEEYLSLFVNSGYDMPTISRMTPEDLTAIGITKPTHRRKLFTEISKLNISDGIPDYKPDSLSLMLKLLRLEEYETTLVSQGYDSVDKVAELTWEDIDDIGIRKLGHQKKLTLAIRKIKNFPRFQPAFRPIPPSSSSHQSLARHSSIDLGNPHARPITVPVPPDQFDQQWTTMPPLQHSVSQTDSFTYPHLRQVNSGSDLHKQDIDEQMYFAWQQQTDNMFAQQQALRGRSLESLEQNFEWYDMVNSWRTQMMADQGQLIEGTSTLNRPRGLIKARPVAKVQGTSTVSIRDQISLDGEDISKPDLLAGQGPIPPKRLMSSGVVKAHDVGDTAFATCVQSLTSRFTLDTREDQLDNIDDEPALALQLSSPNQIPRPPPPEPPPTPTKPSAPQRDKSPIPSGDVSQVAPQVIELNHAMQSELKMKLKQRNHQASTGSSLAAAAPTKPGQDRPKQSGGGGGGAGAGGGGMAAAKSDADLEREKFLAKLESVRKKSERKEEAKTVGRKLNAKTDLQNSGSDASDKERPSQNQETPRRNNNLSSNHSANLNNVATSNHHNSNGASIDKEIRSLQECIQASVMEPTQGRGEAVEDDANDYDTNPFTALLSKIEKNVDKEFLERKRNEKAAASDVAGPTGNLSQASTSTPTTSIPPSTSSLPSSAATSSVSAKIEKIKSIEVKLEPSVGAAAATAVPAATINNLNKERPYEIARSTKTEPVIQNKFFSTIGVETKVINLEDRPHRKSDAGLPSARCNNVGDNQRRTSVSEVGKGAATHHQQNGVNRVPTSVLDAAQLQAAQAEFDNKFGNLNVSKESEKDKKIIEIQEALEEQREGLVSSARRIFEVCANASSGNSANSSPAVPRRNSVRKDGKDGAATAGSPAPPVPHPRTRPPDVPPRNPRNVDEQNNSPPVPMRLPAKNPRRVPETPKVIQDIEHMLSSLTDQLDAMLD